MDHLAEEQPRQQAAHQPDRVVRVGIFAAETRLKHHRKDEIEDGHLGQRMNEGPEDPQKGARISATDVSDDQAADRMPIFDHAVEKVYKRRC